MQRNDCSTSSITSFTQPFSQTGQVFVYKLSACGFEFFFSHVKQQDLAMETD